MLSAVKAGHSSAEDIATASGLALFRVRSGIRDLVVAGYVKDVDGSYTLTDQGANYL